MMECSWEQEGFGASPEGKCRAFRVGERNPFSGEVIVCSLRGYGKSSSSSRQIQLHKNFKRLHRKSNEKWKKASQEEETMSSKSWASSRNSDREMYLVPKTKRAGTAPRRKRTQASARKPANKVNPLHSPKIHWEIMSWSDRLPAPRRNAFWRAVW